MLLNVSSAGANSPALDSYARDRIAFQARRLIRNPILRQFDREDLEQELAIDLVKALRKFDPARAGLRTFICRVLARRCISLLREARRRCRQTASLQDDTANDITADHRHHMIGYTRPDPIQQRERAEAVAAAMDRLPQRLRDIAHLLMHHSQADTARILGVSQTSIDRARKQIAQHFVAIGPENLF